MEYFLQLRKIVIFILHHFFKSFQEPLVSRYLSISPKISQQNKHCFYLEPWYSPDTTIKFFKHFQRSGLSFCLLPMVTDPAVWSFVVDSMQSQLSSFHPLFLLLSKRVDRVEWAVIWCCAMHHCQDGDKKLISTIVDNIISARRES